METLGNFPVIDLHAKDLSEKNIQDLQDVRRLPTALQAMEENSTLQQVTAYDLGSISALETAAVAWEMASRPLGERLQDLTQTLSASSALQTALQKMEVAYRRVQIVDDQSVWGQARHAMEHLQRQEAERQ